MSKSKKMVNYDKYAAENKLKFMARLSELWLKYPGRIGRTRPRTPIENNMLARLDEARKKGMLKSGDLKMLAPRRWKLKVLAG